MKLPLSWLRDLVAVDASAGEVAARLTARGFYVEGVESHGAAAPGVVVARVLEVARHPNADKLSLCRVDGGGDELRLYGWRLGTGAGAIGAAPESELLALGRERLQASADFFEDESAAALPAVGGALGVVREATVDVNLLPADQRRGSEDGMSLATIGMTALVGLLLLVLGASTLIKDELLYRSVTGRLAELSPRVEAVRALQDDIAALQSRLDTLEEGQDRRAVDLVEGLTELVPTSAYLTTLAFRRGRVTMDGHAASASDVLTALEKSRRFKNVAFSSPTTRAGDKERFALAAEVGR